MKITKAIDVLELFLHIYEIEKYKQGLNFKNKILEEEYIATKVLLDEYKNLVKEVSRLAIESVEREKILARLEKEVELACKK